MNEKRKELENKIIELYQSGLSLTTIANIVGFKSKETIRLILKKNNIERRGHAPVYHIFNEDFFENIDNEYKAYYLGFLTADGNVYLRNKENKNNKPCIRMELNNKDRYILEKFKKVLNLDLDIHDTRKNCCKITMHSKKMFDDLSKYGIVPNKTKHEKFIILDNEDMMNHYIRGFFDGDGWCTNTTSHGKRKGSKKCIGFVGNYIFLNDLSHYLNMILDTNLNKIIERQGCSMLLYSSKKDTTAIIDYMYNNSNVYLIRKYNECKKIYVNPERC